MAQRLKESVGKLDDPQFLPVFPWLKTSPESYPVTLDCHRCTSVHAPSLPPVNVIKLKILKNKGGRTRPPRTQPAWQGTEGRRLR